MKPCLSLLLLLYCCLHADIANGQVISTIAGIKDSKGYTGDGGPATSAQLWYPFSIAVDDAGNMYIPDHATVRKVDQQGIITTIAGTGVAGYSGDGGPAIAAKIHAGSVAIDKAGNIYITDVNHYVIRKINTAGMISTIAGNGNWNYDGDDKPATQAGLAPGDIAVDNMGNLFISDYHNNRIRKIDEAGLITTVAGNGVRATSDATGPAVTVPIVAMGLAVDGIGNLYLADNNSRIRKVSTNGVITTIAGMPAHGYSGDRGPATAAMLNMPYDVAVDNAGNIYIADYANHRIREINSAGIISTIAGTGTKGYSGDGHLAVAAQLTYPVCLVADKHGAIYFSDVDHYTVRKISACPFVLKPTLSISASPLPACSGNAVTFTATLTNGGRQPLFEWKVNDRPAEGNGPVLVTNTLADGDVVSCMLTDSIDCVYPAFSNSIVTRIYPSPSVTIQPEITIMPGQNVQLQPVITGPVNTYQWTPATRLSDPAIAKPVASPQSSTAYELKVVTRDGCIAAGKVRVIVYRKLAMPTAFTPNSNRINEVFRIPPGVSFSLNRFSVYNRWGGMVFSTTRIEEGWDGKYKGIPAETGLYVYMITGKDLDKEVIIKGTVYVVR